VLIDVLIGFLERWSQDLSNATIVATIDLLVATYLADLLPVVPSSVYACVRKDGPSPFFFLNYLQRISTPSLFISFSCWKRGACIAWDHLEANSETLGDCSSGLLSPACFHCLALSGKLRIKKKNESELYDSFKEVILLSHVAMTDGLTFGRSHELSSTPWGGHCCCHHVGYLLLWAPFLISLMNVLFLFFFMTSRPSNN
jgi:hypothetical protein